MNILRAGGSTGSENRLSFYILREKKPLILLTITGLIYNLGLTAGPYFEGQLVQCLKNIYGGQQTLYDMLRLAGLYVAVILMVQAARAAKRFFCAPLCQRYEPQHAAGALSQPSGKRQRKQSEGKYRRTDDKSHQ